MSVLEKLGAEIKEILQANVKASAESSPEEIREINAYYQRVYLGYEGNTHETDYSDTSGALFLLKGSDRMKADNLIKALDEFEHAYMPKGFIQVWSGDKYPRLAGTKKYDIDLSKVLQILWAEGIEAFYLLERDMSDC